ncbi:F0F1 ATP synthase subunit C [Streptococcus dentiloxodontae]
MMNLAILALGIACMGVSLGEGILVANIAKSVARQPEMYGKLQTVMFLGVAFIEGTFFVLLASTFFVTTR